MSVEKNILGFINFRGKKRGTSAVGMNSFHQTPVRVADIARSGARGKTKNLISLLLVHGARARRLGLPRTRVRACVFTPAGKYAIKICLK